MKCSITEREVKEVKKNREVIEFGLGLRIVITAGPHAVNTPAKQQLLLKMLKIAS